MASFFKKKQFWGGVIALAIMVYLFYDLDLSRMWTLCGNLRLKHLAMVLACTTGLTMFKAWRWKVIVSRIHRILLWPTISLYATSQLIGVLLPALTGQAGRVLLFSRKGNFTKTYAFSTIFLEVVFDAAGLLILMLLSSSIFVFPPEYRYISYIIAGATFCIMVLFYCSLHYQERLEAIGYRRLRPRSPRIFLVLRKFLRSFNEGIAILRSTDKMLALSVLTFLSWSSHIFSVFFLFKMFNFDLPVLAAVVVIIVNYLALLVPITPGNLGSFQLAVVASLNIFSVHKTEAVLFSVLLYLADMLPMLVFSSFFLFRGDFSLADIGREEELMAEVDAIVSDQTVTADKSK